MIQSPLALVTLVSAMAALSLWLDHRVKFLSQIGAGMIAVILGTVLSNAGLVTAESPVYDALGGGPVTMLAIAWLLLAVNLADVKRAGSRMLGAFALACFGTAVGAFVGALLLASSFGTNTPGLAGTLTGTYTGGSVNFLAVGRGSGLPDLLFAGATAADNLTTGLWLGATLLLPLWLGRFYAPPKAPASPMQGDVAPPANSSDAIEHPYFAGTSMSALDIGILMAAGLALLMLSQFAGSRFPAIHQVLWLTTFSLIAGNLTPLRKVPGALHLGNLALLYFFVIIGIHSRIADILAVGVEVFWFTLIVVAIHGVITFGIGKLAGIDIGTIAVASQAAVGGPSSALAVAVARGWAHLILPGIIVGLLGYAGGSYLGFAVAAVLRSMGVGG
jgi:uncharacterized membrane protein